MCLSRQLLHNSNLSSSNGSTEDLFRDSIDSCDIDISEKVWMVFFGPCGYFALGQHKYSTHSAFSKRALELPLTLFHRDLFLSGDVFGEESSRAGE